jgi:hypothetical protein
MGNILPFRKKAAPKGKTLCLNNHHKWAVVKERQFDVKQGKLVTVERCTRCKKERVRLL